MGDKRAKDKARGGQKIYTRFKMGEGLTYLKVIEFLPSMIVTNLSTLLLITVDGLVVGNFVGSDALASVNIFYPATVLIGAVSVLIASGAATSLSVYMGQNDADGIRRTKSAVVRVMLAAAAAVAVLQIPIDSLIIKSYHLSPEMEAMTWKYATGVMISMPLGLISNVGVYQLQIIGKMKVLMRLSVMEGLVNLGLDLLLVGALHMGVAGAGFGTAGANLLRCSATVIYMLRNTDMYRSGGVKATFEDIRKVLALGVPEATNSALTAVQSYLMMQLLLSAFGADGGVIKGVCTFCCSLINVFFTGVNGSMRPLLGLMTGARDLAGLNKLMLQCYAIMQTFAGAVLALIMLKPEWFYHIHGVADIPDGGLLSLRLYSLCFLFTGVNSMLRIYFANRGDSKFATSMAVSSNVILPLTAFILIINLPAPFIWLAYLIDEALVFSAAQARYILQIKRDKVDADPETGILYLTVSPDDAAEAAEMMMDYADEIGCPPLLSYKVALCMEEMVAYAVKERTGLDIGNAGGSGDKLSDNADSSEFREHIRNRMIENMDVDIDEVQIHIVIRLTPDEAMFMMIDDGRRIAFVENDESREAAANNYEFLKRIAKSVEYHYVLDLNYTVVRF